MNLLDELDSFISKEYGITLTEYRYVNLGGKYVYVEGHGGIKVLSESEISFVVKKHVISIKGEDLIIKYFDKTTAIVQGRIVQVFVL